MKSIYINYQPFVLKQQYSISDGENIETKGTFTDVSELMKIVNQYQIEDIKVKGNKNIVKQFAKHISKEIEGTNIKFNLI